MFIIESVSIYGAVMRQTIYSPRTILPIMRARASLEKMNHRHIRLMNADGQTIDLAIAA